MTIFFASLLGSFKSYDSKIVMGIQKLSWDLKSMCDDFLCQFMTIFFASLLGSFKSYDSKIVMGTKINL
jgi:hypothetical protein